MPRPAEDLNTFLDREVYPALFQKLDAAFPDYGFRRRGRYWQASQDATRALPGSPRPDRVYCYPNRPWGLVVQGEGVVRFLALVNDGRRPDGPDFVPAVKRLCELAGVPFPEPEVSPEELLRLRWQEARRAAVEAVLVHAETALWSEAGAAARAYLTDVRGFTEDEVKELGFGLYDTVVAVAAALRASNQDLTVARDARLLAPALEGYVLVPWADAAGQPFTAVACWPEKPVPEGKAGKLNLSGEGTRRAPLYLDRAQKAGRRDLVAVEGVFDAALLQARGETNVISPGGVQFTAEQLETLARRRVRSVTICWDPDTGGEAGTPRAVDALTKAGIAAYVAPRLPDGLDPDEFLLREGLEGWKAHVEQAVSGPIYRAHAIIGNVSPHAPEADRRWVVEEVLAYLATLRGPWAGACRDDVLRLLVERTGYTAEALLPLAEDFETKRQREEAEKALDAVGRHIRDRGDRPALEVAAEVNAALATLQARTADAPLPFSVDRIREALTRKPQGLASGLETLDRELEVRFHAGELAALLARPAHGKTAALVRLLLNWTRAARGDAVFVLYSFEEPEEFLAARLVAMLTAEAGDGWTPGRVRAFERGETRNTWGAHPEVLAEAWKELRSFEDRLQVVFRPSWTVDDMVDHARTLAARQPVGGVLVDYWQKIPPPGGGSMSGREERRDIALAVVGRRLKALAVDVACPVVAGAQAGRETAKEAQKIPAGKDYTDEAVQKALRSRRFTMQDAREGGIEQEADLVLGLLNFRADFREGEETPGVIPDVTRLEVGVLKNRYGPPGKWAGVAFDGRYGLLRDPKFAREV